jgi:hypothetical protein
MSNARRSFLQRYLNGELSAEDIDGFIDEWHEKPGGKEIFEFLGMTKEEYSLWLCDPDGLAEIGQARRAEVSLIGFVCSALPALAEAGNPREKRLRQWLAQQTEAHPAK